jgi:hypothetical protein
MSEDNQPRRVRVERNIYRRATGVYEVGFKDGTGKQRWRTVAGGITAARAARDELLSRRARGERVTSSPRLRFGDAATRWLEGPVLDLRPATQSCYRNAVDQHLRDRLGQRRLDTITPEDLAELVRVLRRNGLAESTIVIVIGVANRIYRYAARRLGWAGANPVSLMLSSERPKPSKGKRRRIFERGELEQTISAAGEPYRTLFTVAALTGGRLSELLALTWANLRVDDVDDAQIEFAHQVDRRGNLAPTKTDGSGANDPDSTAAGTASCRAPTDVDLRAPGQLRVRDAFGPPVQSAQHRSRLACCSGQSRRRRRSPDLPSPARRGRERESGRSSSWSAAVDAQLPSHGRKPRPACWRKRG